MTATAAAQHDSNSPQRGRPRSDSLQKMLDLEHARKLERLQGHHQSMPVYTHPSHLAFQQVLQRHSNQPRLPQSPPRLSPFPTVHPPPQVKPTVPLQSRRRESSVQLPVKKTDLLPSAMKSARRATALPSLSISVPPPPSNTKAQIDREVERNESAEHDHKHKTVTFLDVDVCEEPTADDASSICHSPSWESFGQNKKRDKKNEAKMRKKEKELLEKQTEKEAKSVKKMLAAKLSKAPPTRPPNASRSISSPTVLADDRLRSNSAQAFYDPPPPIRPHHIRQRSDSVAMQLKAALTGNKTPSHHQLNDEQGFIGGLKLEKKRQEAAGMPFRKPVPPPSLTNQRANSFGPDVTVTPPAFTPPGLPRSSSFSPQLEAYNDRAGTALDPRPPRVASMHVPSWCQPLVSPTAPPVPDISNLKQWKNNASKQRDDAVDDDLLEPPNALSEFVLEQERGRRRESYVHQSRQQSRERSIHGFKDEVRVSSAKSHYPPQANRQHQSRAQPSSSESSPLGGNFQLRNGSLSSLNVHDDQPPHGDDFTLTFRLPYTPPAHGSPLQGSFDRSTSQGPPASRMTPREIPLPAERSTSRDRLPPTPGAALKSFRDAAKAAFYKVSSPSSSKPPVSSYFTRPARDTTMTPDSATSSRYSTDEPLHFSGVAVRPFAESAESGMPSRESSARPTNRSSMSSCEEGLPSPSPATTPDSSRPQSEKGLPSVDGEIGRVDNETVVVSDDTRSYRQSHTAMLTSSPTIINPRISLPPQIPVQNHESHLNELEALVTERFGRKASVADAEDSDSSQSYPTPTHTESSKTSTMASPLTSASLTSPQEYGQKQQSQAGNAPLPAPASVLDESSCIAQRRLSLTKSRSSPDLALDTSFLPKLKHQPLVPRPLVPQPPPRSSKRGSVSNLASKAAAQASQPPDMSARKSIVSLKTPASPSSYLEEARKSMQGPLGPRSNRLSRPSIVPPNGTPEPVAKMLVECCSCKFLHDMPSKVYECMANPDAKVEDRRLGVSGVISTAVKCPWCSHGMTTRCCAGYAAVIYLKEKLH
ncbi:hypothetical protein CH63R_05885 [Colletotrichum higginsianum IMI 349063]|uniref:Bgh specific protein n=3 Tax=Colletotrichum higginsianum TaxID=80884 RepID=A0A1B7YDQ7_COLHI|nr:hypothetical protein CH63R_05885 [Colletotrichum higginsianum IMI 349063]OBR10193.1 hypothetical protein CH63R_05885 [Colletotrichum higginsianum IMI 349063]